MGLYFVNVIIGLSSWLLTFSEKVYMTKEFVIIIYNDFGRKIMQSFKLWVSKRDYIKKSQTFPREKLEKYQRMVKRITKGEKKVFTWVLDQTFCVTC